MRGEFGGQNMNKKHRKTLAAIFSSPTPRNIAFRDVEALLVAIGCEVYEGAGSRVLFTHQGIDWPTHRPHPQKEAKLYHVKEVRNFLEELGVRP